MQRDVYEEYMKVIETFKLVRRQNITPPKSSRRDYHSNQALSSSKSAGNSRNLSMIKFHDIFLDESPSNTLSVTIKNYMVRDGLSRMITEDPFFSPG